MSIFRFSKSFYDVLLCLCCLLGITNLNAQIDTAGLILPQQSACLGDTIMVALTVTDFTDVSAYEFSLGWSDNRLMFLGVCELAAGNSSDVVTPQGDDRIQLTWVDFTGMGALNLTDGDTLMLLKFVVQSNLGTGAMINFMESTNPTLPSREITVINEAGFFTYEPHIVDGVISQDQSIALQANATAITCRDSLSQLTASSAQFETTYTWSGPNAYIDSIAMPTTGNIGTYTVIGQNGNCFDTTMVEVIFDTISPMAFSLVTDTINCLEPIATLSGSVNEQNIAYQWIDEAATPLGTGNQITTSTIGWYYLIATRQDNGCSSQDSIQVVDDLIPPDLMVTEGPFELTCNLPDLTIHATTNSDSVTWVWENIQGLFLSATDSLVVGDTGDYNVEVTNTQNGCSDNLSFTVSDHLAPPAFLVEGNQVLDCNNDSQWLQAVFNNNDSLDFNWLAVDFSVLMNSDSILLTEAGTYYLNGIDLISGCADTLAFVLTQDTISPTGTVLPGNATLDCVTSSLAFTLSADTTGLDIVWEDFNNSLFGIDSTQVTVDEVGVYNVLLTDENNGCSHLVPFEVLIDTLSPTFTLNMPDTISCLQNEVAITISPDDANWQCEWEGLVNSCSTLVSNSGVYQATVTNSSNGCQSTDSLQVFAAPDTIAIAFNLDMPYSLTCENDSIFLQTSSTTQNVEWSWSDENNAVISNADSLWVNAAGNYEVMAMEPNTGCEATTSFSVTENTMEPSYTISGLDQLNCSQETVVWNAFPDNNINLTYNWFDETETLLSTIDSVVLDNPGNYTVVATDTINACTTTNVFEITQDTLSPDLTFQLPIPALNCSVDSVLATFTTSVGNYTANWENEGLMSISTTDSVMIHSAGDYSLLLSNLDNGCSTFSTFSVMIDTLSPTLNLTVSDTLDCETQEVDLLISTNEAGLDCSWEGISTNCQITVDAAGWYYAEVSNPVNNCQTLDSIEVIDMSSLFVAMIVPPNLLNCANETVSLLAQNTGNSQVNEWLAPNGMIFLGDSIEVSEAGEYSLFALDEFSNCRDTISVLVSEDFTTPEGEASASNELNCAENEAVLMVSNLGSNTKFVWADEQNNPLTTTTVDIAGTYYLNLLDSISQCSVIDSLVLVHVDELPLINWMYLGDSVLTCDQTQLTLQVNINNPDIEYQWTNPATNEELSTNSILLVNEPQTILLTIQDSTSGCMADTMLTIVANLTPPLAEIVELTPFNCTSSEGVLSAFQSNSINNLYYWDVLDGSISPATPDNTQTLIFEPATYILLVENTMNGCQSADTLLVTNDIQAPNGLIADVLNPGCNNATGSIIVQSVIGGTSPYTYAIGTMPFSLSTAFSSLTVGDYLIQVEDALGCTYDSVFTIEQNLLFDVSIVGPAGPSGIGDEITLIAQGNQPFTNQDSLVWYRDGALVCANCLSINDTLLASATYTLEAYNNNGCTSTDMLFIPVNEELVIYIPNAFSPNEDGINDRFQIFPGAGIKSVSDLKIWNRWGGLVYEVTTLGTLPDIGWQVKKDNNSTPSGVYVYQFVVELINGKKELYSGEVLLVW